MCKQPLSVAFGPTEECNAKINTAEPRDFIRHNSSTGFVSLVCDELESVTRDFQEMNEATTMDTATAKQLQATKRLDYASLHAAVKGADFHQVEEMVKVQGIAMDANGFTALHAAAAFGHVEVVEMLLCLGLDLNQYTKAGTPLSCAVTSGHRVVIKSLLFARANPNVGLLNGITPLHLAARKGDAWITQILLEAGANPYVADENGNTPLDFAAAHNAPREVFNLLLEKETEMKSIQVDCDMFENFDDLVNTFQFPPNFSMEVSTL